MTKEELKDYLEGEAGYSHENVNGMDCSELIGAWCEYEGLINYSDAIVDAVFAAYEDIALEMVFNDIEEDEQPEKLAELYESMSEDNRDEFLRLISE